MNPQNQNSQLHIYLADDDEDDRSIFIDALQEVDSSIIITEAIDGKQLMNQLTISNPLPDIIFLDINMPMRDGFECLEEIRSHNGNLKKLIIIMLSTSRNPEIIEKAFKLGATFYAVKPNSFDDLKTFIKEVIEIDWFSPELKNRKFRLI